MFMFHLVVKPRYFDKPTSRSLRRALLALHDQMSFYRVDKLGIPHPSWINLIGLMYKKIIHETFRDSNLELMVFILKTRPERTTSGDHNTATEGNRRHKHPTLESIK